MSDAQVTKALTLPPILMPPILMRALVVHRQRVLDTLTYAIILHTSMGGLFKHNIVAEPEMTRLRELVLRWAWQKAEQVVSRCQPAPEVVDASGSSSSSSSSSSSEEAAGEQPEHASNEANEQPEHASNE